MEMSPEVPNPLFASISTPAPGPMSPALLFNFVFLDAAPDFGAASHPYRFLLWISFEEILLYRSISFFIIFDTLHPSTLPFSANLFDLPQHQSLKTMPSK